MTELTLRPARQVEAGRVAYTLASAFIDEPSVVAMLGRGAGRFNKLIQLFQLQLGREYLRTGVVDLALIDNEIAGAALWSAPRAGSGSALAQLRLVPAYLNVLGRDFLRAARLESNSLRVRPKQPHWYLYMLGVAPEHQGRGVGGRLLDHRLALLPDDEPAYLEASQPASARLYARHGFTNIGAVPLLAGRTMQGMWRPAGPGKTH